MSKDMKRIRGYFKGLNKDADTVEFIASTDSVDRQGESIDPNGWDLSNIGKNLPLLWAHNDRELPIGRVVDARIEGNALIATVEFANKVNDFAKKVYDMVIGGFLNAVSVGFMPKAFDAEGRMVSQELLELSVVNIPANQDALRNSFYLAFQKSLEMEEKKEEKIEEKELTITEKNRNALRIAVEGMKQAVETLGNLLNEATPEPKGETIKGQPVRAKDKRIYKSVRMVDHIVEAIIHDLKNGGE